MPDTVLVRYGAIPEVAKFELMSAEPIERGSGVVVRTHRGLQLGTFLERLKTGGHGQTNGVPPGEPPDFVVIRPAVPADLARADQLRAECEAEFDLWRRRIGEWKLQLELIDLERTFDGEKLVLYVLNDRGPDCTKLALQAAAAGLGTIEVQPVGAEGLMQPEPSRGGCGNGG